MNGHQNEAFSCLIGALNSPRKVNGYGADYARYAAESTGVIQQWYQWRDHWQNEQAEEWMHENSVDFKDGIIVADGKHTFVWSWDDE